MPEVTIRFYEELNEFLPRHLPRKKDLQYRYTVKTTVRNAIEAFNVPHTEVDLILVNGGSAGLDDTLEAGDRVSVYPQFETLDISKVSRIKQAPLRNPQFIVDVNLGKLAAYLRMLGFDTLYQNNFSDSYIVETAHRETRIILTRDLGVLKYRSVNRGYYVRAQDPQAQIREVVSHFSLQNFINPLTRCIKCNGPLQQVDKTTIKGKVPDQTYRCYEDFLRCRDCSKIYWKGGHYYRMLEFARKIQQV